MIHLRYKQGIFNAPQSQHMRTVQVASIGYQGMIYVFPGAEDGSIQIIAATSSGSAVRVVLDRQATKKLASHLSEEVVRTDCHNTEAQFEPIDGDNRFLKRFAVIGCG